MKDNEKIRFGTVGAPSTTPTPGTPAAIEHIRRLGLDHLEIAWVQSVRVSDETCAQIKAAAFLQTFVEYPPSQRPASFSIDQIRKGVDKKIDESFRKRGLE